MYVMCIHTHYRVTTNDQNYNATGYFAYM
jgi:hypothetical protein